MNLLHVIPSIDALRGGPSRALLDMVQALTQKNIHNTVVAAEGNSKDFNQSTDSKLIVFPSLIGRRWGFSPALSKWISKNISNYDIVHIHSFFSYTTLRTANEANKQHIPYVLRPAGALDEFSFQQKQFKKQLFFNFFGEQILKNAKMVHCTSRFEEAQILKKDPTAKTKIIPLGTYLEGNPRNENEKNSALTLIYLGRFYPNKGLELLIQAVARLKNSGRELKLILAGKGDPSYEMKLKNLIQQEGVAGQILWVGFLGEAEKAVWFAKADVFVLPSDHENFGISAVEAMACGLPVIVSDQVGISEEIVSSKAGLIIERNESQLIAAIEHFINNPKDIEQIGTNAQKLAEEKFRWPQIADQLTELYNSILNER